MKNLPSVMLNTLYSSEELTADLKTSFSSAFILFGLEFGEQ
jgi:hypothetical protein